MTLDDLRHAVLSEAKALISADELCRWATMLLLNDAFVWDYENAKIADTLQVLSMPKLFGKESGFEA